MNDNSFYQTTSIIDIDEQMKKQEELLNTIRMEPILEKTIIQEEPLVTIKRKRATFTDYVLVFMIVVLSVAFVGVILKVF